MDPIKARISKHRIGAIIERVRTGEPVEPEGTIWTMVDCLTVAGVLLSSAMSAGTHARGQAPGGPAGVAGILQDFQAAMEFVGAMATAYGNDTWDEYFEPTVTIGIRSGSVTPLDGFKR